jgi:peroxiredoxin
MAYRFAAFIALAAVIAGCAGGGAGIERIRRGDTAPSFVLNELTTGEEINSSKTVPYNYATVVAIWSLACPDCREALVGVQRVYEEYGSQSVAFLGINFDVENIQGVRAFIKGEGIGFPMLWDKRQRVARSYKALDYTFSVFVLDREGTVVLAQYDHPPDLEQRLTRAIDVIGRRALE